MSWTDIGVVAALVFGVVNLVLLATQLKQDRQLRMAEIAMRMVEAEYKRYELAEGIEVTVYTPQQLFDLSLPVVREVMETSTFDAEKYFDFAKQRLEHFKRIEKEKAPKKPPS